MRRVKIAPLMVVLSLLAAGCSDSLTDPRLSAEQFDLVFTLSDDEIGPDGFVTAELTVTSRHPNTVVLHGNGSCAELLVLKDGEPVPFAKRGFACPMPLYQEEFVLPPGETRSLSWTVVSSLADDFGEHVAGDLVPPGFYTVRARTTLLAGGEGVEISAEAPLIVDDAVSVNALEFSLTVTPDEVAQHEEFVLEFGITNPHHRPVSLRSTLSCPWGWLPRVYRNEELFAFEGTLDLGCLPTSSHFVIDSGDILAQQFSVRATMLGGSPDFEAGDPAPLGTYRATLLSYVVRVDGHEADLPPVEATFTVTEPED